MPEQRTKEARTTLERYIEDRIADSSEAEFNEDFWRGRRTAFEQVLAFVRTSVQRPNEAKACKHCGKVFPLNREGRCIDIRGCWEPSDRPRSDSALPDFDALAVANQPKALCPIGAYVRSPNNQSLGVGRILHSKVEVVYADGQRFTHGGNCLVPESPWKSDYERATQRALRPSQLDEEARSIVQDIDEWISVDGPATPTHLASVSARLKQALGQRTEPASPQQTSGGLEPRDEQGIFTGKSAQASSPGVGPCDDRDSVGYHAPARGPEEAGILIDGVPLSRIIEEWRGHRRESAPLGSHTADLAELRACQSRIANQRKELKRKSQEIGVLQERLYDLRMALGTIGRASGSEEMVKLLHKLRYPATTDTDALQWHCGGCNQPLKDHRFTYERGPATLVCSESSSKEPK